MTSPGLTLVHLGFRLRVGSGLAPFVLLATFVPIGFHYNLSIPGVGLRCRSNALPSFNDLAADARL